MRFAIQKPADTVGATWPAVLTGLFIAFGGFLFGFGAPGEGEQSVVD
jgi:hypothetical protein